MHTLDITESNIEKIGQLFPNCLTERIGEDGKVERVIDFDQLRQELSKEIVEGPQERYQFTWPDKKKAIRLANTPSNMTLRPVKDNETKPTGLDSDHENYLSSGSVNFSETENLYIEGDNLEVLKLLRENYLGKIQMIYIDPPYNTGRNLIYKNDFTEVESKYLENSGQFDFNGNKLVVNPESNGRFHTDWLNMVYPRLKIARDLLSEDGIVVITIDDCEIETLTMIMNEVFGAINHLATIIIKNNPSGRSTLTGVSISHEYALFYGKSNIAKLGRLPRDDRQVSRYKEEDEVGKYEWVNFRKHGGYKEDAPTMYFPIYIKKDASSFRIPKMKWNDSTKEYNVHELPFEDEFVSYPIDENGRPRRWKWSLDRTMNEKEEMSVRLDKDNNPAVYIKSRMKEEGLLPLTVWDDKHYSSTEYGTNLLIDLFGEKFFDYPKSLYAVIDCIKTANVKKDSIVLDFFSGSATTAHAVMKLNSEDGGKRKFIMVQLPEKTYPDSVAYKSGYMNICEIGKERIRRAGKKILQEQEKSESNFGLFSQTESNPKVDIGFRVLKLDSSNMQDVYYRPEESNETTLFEDNIKPDRIPEDLLFQVMLECNLPLSAKIKTEKIAGKDVFSVNNDYLIACFDEDVNEEVITAVAKRKPYYFIMRDKSLSSDNVADNFEQIFQAYSKETIRRIL